MAYWDYPQFVNQNDQDPAAYQWSFQNGQERVPTGIFPRQDGVGGAYSGSDQYQPFGVLDINPIGQQEANYYPTNFAYSVDRQGYINDMEINSERDNWSEPGNWNAPDHAMDRTYDYQGFDEYSHPYGGGFGVFNQHQQGYTRQLRSGYYLSGEDYYRPRYDEGFHGYYSQDRFDMTTQGEDPYW